MFNVHVHAAVAAPICRKSYSTRREKWKRYSSFSRYRPKLGLDGCDITKDSGTQVIQGKEATTQECSTGRIIADNVLAETSSSFDILAEHQLVTDGPSGVNSSLSSKRSSLQSLLFDKSDATSMSSISSEEFSSRVIFPPGVSEVPAVAAISLLVPGMDLIGYRHLQQLALVQWFHSVTSKATSVNSCGDFLSQFDFVDGVSESNHLQLVSGMDYIGVLGYPQLLALVHGLPLSASVWSTGLFMSSEEESMGAGRYCLMDVLKAFLSPYGEDCLN